MQPPEFIVVLALVLCGTFLSWYLLSNIFSYLRGRKVDAGEVKLSELQAIIEMAVERANKPLIERIERLEQTVEQQALPRRRAPLLDDDEFLAEAPEKMGTARVERQSARG